jgi:hypothetical protein
MTEEQFDELRPSAFAIAYRMLGSVSETEDVVHEGFLRLYRARGRRADRASARPHDVTPRCLDEPRLRGGSFVLRPKGRCPGATVARALAATGSSASTHQLDTGDDVDSAPGARMLEFGVSRAPPGCAVTPLMPLARYTARQWRTGLGSRYSSQTSRGSAFRGFSISRMRQRLSGAWSDGEEPSVEGSFPSAFCRALAGCFGQVKLRRQVRGHQRSAPLHAG